LWKCKLLFVRAEEVYEIFVKGENLKPLHGSRQ
jgi:hypothetical protein